MTPWLSSATELSGQHPGALVALVAAGFLASSVNAVAGGGTLISFPALLLFGVPTIPANATNSIALWPGALSSALGFWPQLQKQKRQLLLLMPPTATGSLLGAWLLMRTPDRLFATVVPALILLATLLLAFQKRIRAAVLAGRLHAPPAVAIGLQFLISVYGGYFGAGMGIMMLAVLGLIVPGTLHDMNALKVWLQFAVNLVCSAFFLTQGVVWVVPALALMIGAILGGYLSARLSQRVDPEKLRVAVVVLGVALTVWYGRVLFQ